MFATFVYCVWWWKALSTFSQVIMCKKGISYILYIYNISIHEFPETSDSISNIVS